MYLRHDRLNFQSSKKPKCSAYVIKLDMKIITEFYSVANTWEGKSWNFNELLHMVESKREHHVIQSFSWKAASPHSDGKGTR